MLKIHPLKELIELRKSGILRGICSICSANEYVIEAAMEKALEDNSPVLIEATANQVNQFGGYTGMKPADFRDFVFSIAKKTGFPMEKIILGGDHLGPLTWKNEKSLTAMEKACELVRQYALSGFTKIHIDPSMHLADDDQSVRLDTHIIAQRSALLCEAAENAYGELRKSVPDAPAPVYVIGSEVPVPGGSQEMEDELQVTTASDFEETVEAFKQAFYELGLYDGWDNVIAVVVQPGVEFGDDFVHDYDREKAKKLCESIGKYPDLVFEGHSTDYQTKHALKKMVEDGIAILKVGPELTFALREAFFACCHIEDILYGEDGETSRFIYTLENVMLNNPEHWLKYYKGSEKEIKYKRKYSYSDRCRYYLKHKDVVSALDSLVHNLSTVSIPPALLSQYFPVQYRRIREGKMQNNVETVIKDKVKEVLDKYTFATIGTVKS